MKSLRAIVILLCLTLCSRAFAQTNDIDTELSNLADKLAAQIEDQGKKKVAVIDFSDLDGGTSELGKYVSEQLTVDLVMNRKGFSVLDRANLKKILAEHKLTATGLIDPDNAKKLGQFAGVDAFVLGTIAPKGNGISLTAKIITTDTAEIVGAGRAEFKSDNSVQQLMSKSSVAAVNDTTASTADDTPKATKTFGNLTVELLSLKIVNSGQYILTMTLTNRSAKNSVWVALGTDHFGYGKDTLVDPNGNQFVSADVTGISYGQLRTQYEYNGMEEYFDPSTEIQSGDSTTATITFASPNGARASPGVCNVQLEFFLGSSLVESHPKHATTPNLTAKLEAK